MQGQQYSQHGQQYAPQGPAFNMMPNGGDAFMTGLATDVLQQQSATYIQRGQAFMQQRMGFLSTDVMHYFFNLNSEYGEAHCNACGTYSRSVSDLGQAGVTAPKDGCSSW